MMHPAAGVAFTLADDGDLRADPDARTGVSERLGISNAWATVTQVHGNAVVAVDEPGNHGEADALFTSRPDLPLAVFTADCFGVVVAGDGVVGVAHAGWRGVDAGVVPALRSAIEARGLTLTSAYVGPGIGPCCFEVGPEVAERFVSTAGTTSWGTRSVDLEDVLARQLEDLSVWSSGRCTMHQPGHHSHRSTATAARMAAIGWLVGESGTRS